jgi:hypothetical protein
MKPEYTKGDEKRTITEVRVLSISKLDRPAKNEGHGAAARRRFPIGK